MRLIFLIDDSQRCYEEYQATGNMPQRKIRVVDIDLNEDQKRKLRTLQHENVVSVNIKL